MAYSFPDKYINLLTDFGFKRIFGTEPNKALLIDFLNTLLPKYHQIQNLTFKNTENLGNTQLDRKAIFDIYCQGENGERFIVEIQKAKQTFFKDRSLYYSTFPIQEQADQGIWNYKLSPVYTIGVLDFIFADQKDKDKWLHIVELKDQDCEIFYNKLKYIYIELPKFDKNLDQLETHLEKWIFVLKYLSTLTEKPQNFQSDSIFNQLFEVAEIANFTSKEQNNYQNSLKYYRDLHNILHDAIEKSKEEGLQQGLEQGIQQGLEEGLQQGLEQGIQQGLEQGIQQERTLFVERQRTLVLRLLSRTLGEIPQEQETQINQLSLEQVESLNEDLLDFSSLQDLRIWLQSR